MGELRRQIPESLSRFRLDVVNFPHGRISVLRRWGRTILFVG
jgi:hypothetical protein